MWIFLVATSVLASTCLAESVTLTLPLSPGADARRISPSLVSLSIEMDRWTDWVGSTSRNEFLYNTLDNLKRLTGEPPQIRIGGNTEDRSVYNPAAKFAELSFPDPTHDVPYPEASNVTLGQLFYQTTRFLPTNTKVTWGLNFGVNDTTIAYQEALAIAEVFRSPEIKQKGITLDFVELGNEPDLYKTNNLRSPNYTIPEWVNEWMPFASNVSGVFGINEHSYTKFLGCSFSGKAHDLGFAPQDAFEAGLLKGPGRFISTISQHRYSGSFCAGSGGLLQDLMTKSTIRGNLSVFAPDIQAVSAHGLDYVLGETNSYSCHGAPGVSNTAGAALWAIDYALHANTLGVSTVFFHEGIGYKYALIQPATLTRSILDGSPLPEPLPPHVQPTYYAAVIIGEAIGSSGKTRMAEISVDNPLISAYAFFEGEKLARVVIINSKAYLPDSAERATIHIDLGFLEGKNAPQKIRVKRLSIGRATDDSGVKWGGQTYETSSGRPSGAIVTETASLKDGVDIKDTEAVLLSF